MMTFAAAPSTTLLTGAPRTLTVLAALGAGIAGGVFFAFSTFVMPALRKLTDSQGLAAMNAINKAAPNPLFMLVLFGTALLAVVLVVLTLRDRHPATPWLVAGAVCYLAQIVLTAAYHVPHNNALALVHPGSAGSATAWHHYYTGWTLWNHVRTVTCIAAAALFTVGLRVG